MEILLLVHLTTFHEIIFSIVEHLEEVHFPPYSDL